MRLIDRRLIASTFVSLLVLPLLTALLIATPAPLLVRILCEQRRYQQSDAYNRRSGNVSESSHRSPLSRPLPDCLLALRIRRHITLDL